MENKYFTPDIEDICVGYECEICPHLGYKDEWIPVTGKCEEIPGNGVKDCNLDELTYDCLVDGYIGIRVPYLTKEQIEAEGWKHTGGKLISGANQYYEKKEKYSPVIIYSTDNRKIKIEDSEGNTLLETVECKDINTFRKIIKLLGI